MHTAICVAWGLVSKKFWLCFINGTKRNQVNIFCSQIQQKALSCNVTSFTVLTVQIYKTDSWESLTSYIYHKIKTEAMKSAAFNIQ